MVRQTGAGVAGDVDLVFAHERGQLGGFHGINLMHLETAAFGAFMKLLGEGGIDVAEVDFVKNTFVLVQLDPNHRANPSDTKHECVCNNKSLGNALAARSYDRSGRKSNATWQLLRLVCKCRGCQEMWPG